MTQLLEKTIREEYAAIENLDEAKQFLLDILKERYDTKLSFTLYNEIDSILADSTQQANRTIAMKSQYLSVFYAVDRRMQRWTHSPGYKL